jgi:glutamyl-tRNA synthetase
MRGDDHISNTPKQILLYQALGAALPQFAHLPVILGEDGKKLSKRRNAVAVADYSDMGILPQAMRNFLALLGWSPGEDREVLETAELIALFSAESLLKKASVFDTKKLEWMNGQHMARMPIADFDAVVRPMIVEAGVTTDAELSERRAWWHQVIELLRIRSRTTLEFINLAVPYFRNEITLDEQAVAKHWKDPAQVRTILARVKDTIATATWTAEELESSLRLLASELGVSAGKLFQPLRVALTGAGESPGIFDVLLLLGRERSVARLSAALAQLPR